MDYSDGVAVIINVLVFVVGCFVGAWLVSHGPCTPLPTSVPAGLAADPAAWTFSPTGGYIHINYRPKEEKK